MTMDAFPAKWWSQLEKSSVRCQLCPRHCTIAPGHAGYCGVRLNHDGTLLTLSYGHPVSVAIDPIEKKPFNCYMPGTQVFSFGTFGCNLGCVFCQNDTLSRGTYQPARHYDYISPEQIVDMALKHHCPSIAYTYNEPAIFAEYILQIAPLARQAGLKNILVSNGYMEAAAADELYPLIDAANIDMKGFTEEYYATMCKARLAPVLASIKKLYQMKKHLEITTLVVPGKNDSDADILAYLQWVKENLNQEIPLHFSAYHPAYQCAIPATLPNTLYHIRDLAYEAGFSRIFLGNI